MPKTHRFVRTAQERAYFALWKDKLVQAFLHGDAEAIAQANAKLREGLENCEGYRSTQQKLSEAGKKGNKVGGMRLLTNVQRAQMGLPLKGWARRKQLQQESAQG